MKYYIQILFLFISFSLSANANSSFIDAIENNENNDLERYYPAQEQEGYIGIFEDKPLDSPTDNVFTISLDELPKANEEVWLTYELYGISNHTGISRSINDQLSVGGFMVTFHYGWQEQKEQLKTSWLEKGKNIIRFTLPKDVPYNYRIKNLGIQVKKKTVSGRSIVLNQSTSQEYIKNFGYIKGFVEGKDAESAQVYIDDIHIRSLASEFEALVPKKTEEAIWESTLKVVFPDGEIITKQIVYKSQIQAHYQNKIAIRSANHTIKNYTPTQVFELALQEASIDIEPQALPDAKPISITALRDVDIPVLDGTMVNVTMMHTGYRFLPHGTQFSKEATISLGYDVHKIPDGYTAKDIKTYYFDENTKHWVALKKDSINHNSHQIISKTTHFTDMINGIIKVPESPETAGFTPTSIKDIKAANPSSAVNMIEPPSANNMGTANMGYPIVLPAGRQGMQPELGIQYSSGGGNDWLGLGWNLQIPSVSIDTRWGVPRYDSAMETETYSLGGKQLAPVAHRGVLVARTSEKQFYPRVESSFNKIIRHGDNPNNYWWEVTDKSGTTYSYGGTSSLGIVDNSVLKDSDGNIAHWALVEVRDLNDNFVRYHCTKVMDVGVQGGSVPGHNIYIDRITYTGHGASEGKYDVTFIRDRQLGENKRIDITINARFGLKQVTADLLRKIEVKFNGQNIRSYELTYTQGAFYKTLLEKITEFDAAGLEFNHHDFEYFDDVNAAEGYQPYTSEENWTPQDDNVKGNFVNPLNLFNDDASALSGTKSSSVSAGIAVTFGIFDGQLQSKSNTIGPKVSFSSSNSEGLLALVDINGDGLADKVFKDGGLKCRINQSGPDGDAVFGELRDITGVSHFSKAKTTSTNVGVEAHPLIAFIGYDESKSKTKEEIYFSDVNGDRLVDIVANGTVYFNHINANGDPEFTVSSSDTPSYIVAGSNVDTNVFTQDSAELEEMIDQFPLHDVVRMWVAPCDGIVSVTGDVSLIIPTEASGTADGVRVVIQKSATELWNTTITASDFSSKTPTGVDALTVTKGERIYFRVQSIFDGTDDQVSWNPTITYTQHVIGLNNANEKPIYEFNASDDFIITANQYVAVPIDGTITIEGTFVKPITSDGLTARIVNNSDGSIVWQQTYTDQQTANEVINESVVVEADDSFSFEVESDSNVDWNGIQWQPYLYYTASSDPDYPTVTAQNGDPLIAFYPVVNYSVYATTIQKAYIYEATQDVTITITPQFTVSDASTGFLSFTVKKTNELLAKQEVTVLSGTTSPVTPIMVNVLTGDRLFLEYHTGFDVFTEINTEAQSTIIEASDTLIVDAGLFALNEDITFGPLYRGWGQFGYNGNRDRATQPINESELELDDELLNPSDPNGISDPEDLEGEYNPMQSNFILLIASSEDQAWKGYDDLTYVKATEISASRMGEDDLSLSSPFTDATASGTGATGIVKITKSKTKSFALGAGFGPVSGSYSTSSGYTENVSDFVDMNGDSYPDIVTATHIQYTNARGGLMGDAVLHNLGRHRSEHEADGFTLGGSFITSKSSNTTASKESGISRQIKAMKTSLTGGHKGTSMAEREAQASIGISGNFSEGEDEIKHSWMDVNGDGLPDKVYQGGEVALNLGYKFAPKEQWGYSQVRAGENLDYGGGIGVNFGNWSIAAGVSLSRTENDANTALQDINGDGLVDILIRPQFSSQGGGAFTVHLNTGNGFAPAINWDGAEAINDGASTGEAANVAFTVCIPLIPPFTVAKLCINPSASLGQGVSRQWSQISDLDGDGFPDVLQSKKDNQLKVKRSTIGRTNLLKGVKRPMGAEFAVDYKRIGNTYEQPIDLWALAKVEMNDGVAGDGADIMVSSFEYEEGFYDRHERGFYGFAKVKSNQLDTENGNALYRTVVQEFKNDNFYENGILIREVLQDADENLFTESLNNFELKDVINGSTLPESYKQNDAGAAFVAATDMQKNFYEGEISAQKSTNMTYSYDVLGNVTSYTDFGDPGSDDDITSNIIYHNVPSKYIVGSPSEITVSGGGQTLRKRQTDIDNNTGNVTQIRKYLEGGSASIYDMDYDAFGNISKMTRPENGAGERLFYDYLYDTEVNTYAINITDGYGYSSSSEYDLRFGQMLLSTDLNGHQMRYEIDDLGRISTITGPFELEAGLPYTIAFEYHPEAEVPWAGTKHYDPAHPDNDLETVTFIDGINRTLQVKKDGAIHTAPQDDDEEQMIVSGRLTFDAFGRTTENYHPITEAKGSEGTFNLAYDGIAPTRNTFDVLDRELTVVLPDNATTETQFGFGTDRDGNTQFSTKVIDANGIWKESFTNVRGLTKAVAEQYSQGSNIWTSYNYNAINELIVVKDDQDNLINSSYDWFGRRTEIIHPDAGITVYEYDLASNLTKKLTANLAGANAGITYTYDHERLTNITYPENSQNDVTYTYGDAGAAENRAGHIVLQEDATGSQEFFYNQLGAVTKNIRTIVVPDSEILYFTTQWEYDTWNRVTSMIYPDEEVLTYNYNLGGLLNNFSGVKEGTEYDYLTQLGYDKFEQRVYLSYGNGTETFYSYEPDRRRLETMIAETAEDRKMMDNVYTYDNVNNILRLQNNADIPSSNLMGGQTDYNYTYDDLYRLTSATGSHLGSNHEDKYRLTMGYNSIHSIVSKDQLHEFKGYDEIEWSPRNKTTYIYDYEYEDVQPHAPIHIGERAYTYDANGNQTGWTHDVNGQEREILWDEENRIKAIADNGELFNYVYDAEGERILKSNGGGQDVLVNGSNTGGSGNGNGNNNGNGNGNDGDNGSIGNYTIYINPYVVVRNSQVTKHFYIENQRIVTKLVEAKDGLLQFTDGSTTTNNINYTKKKKKLNDSVIKMYNDLGIDIDKTTSNNRNFSTGQKEDTPTQNKNNGNDGGIANGGGNGNQGGNGNNKEAFIYYYHPDHLGSSAYITDINGEVTQHVEYFAFGETFLEEHSNTERTPYLFNGKELDEETGLYYYGARYYDAKTSVWQSVDPPILGKFLDGQHNGGVYSSKNLMVYGYTYQSPVVLIDIDGNSTHIDTDGNVVAVFQDGDKGVYQHPANADGGAPTLYMLTKRQQKWGTAAHGKKIGETAYWDEFISPETGQTMTNYTIQVSKSFDPIIEELSTQADNMDLKEIARESSVGGKFDIKVPYENVGGLLNGKYATSRSAGNYLAGYNAEGGTYFGVGISFDTFQKLAGALHVKGSLSTTERMGIVLKGTSYGPAPTFGEIMYQYRMSKAGWEQSKKDNSQAPE